MNSRLQQQLFISVITAFGPSLICTAEVNKVETVAPDVYFHEGDLGRRGHCNNGWIVFEDYVLVVDGNFPSGAQEVIPKIKAITNKPIRFAFDTHHHGDHAYGNQVWVENGATPVAHTGVIDEMKKYETGYYGNTPGRWEDAAKGRPDVAKSKLKPPTLLFRNEMIFDDGKHRVELHHFGVAHTHGDGFAWLPKERILFTGDACVNGPYNYMGDGNSEQWIKTLQAAQKLGAKTICPGHGPTGGPEVLEDQIAYFVSLRNEVKKVADKKPEEVKAAVDQIKETLRKNERIARYIGAFFPAQVEKVYVEMGGKPFQTASVTIEDDKLHADSHGRTLAVKPSSDKVLLSIPRSTR
ncbi:MAG: MBL fold metallo-hydrolase [Verrucomicrobia bacterium]|nr:MBL fold metallo-hydrolase [Verrucomicrobiota bacterium]